jgi:hypothetical protein
MYGGFPPGKQPLWYDGGMPQQRLGFLPKLRSINSAADAPTLIEIPTGSIVDGDIVSFALTV